MSEVVEIDRIEDLQGFRLLWNSLFPRTRGANFFQSIDWLLTYWKHFGAEQQLRVLIVYSDGAPIGIVPLTIITERTRLGRVRVLTYPLHDWGSYYGPIGPNPTATLVAAMGYLSRTAQDWDMMDLRWADADGVEGERTKQAMQLAGLQDNKSVWKEIAIVDTRGTWESYLSTRPRKFRRNLRSDMNRAAELGARHIRYRPLGSAHGDDDPRWDLFDSCVELARRSWQGKATTGTTLSHESVYKFFRETHEAAVKTGSLDLNLLVIGERPIAFGYNYHHGGYCNGIRTGYDPEFSTSGIGNVLYALTLMDSFGREDHTFDLGPEYLSSKRPWSTQIARSYRYTHYSLAAPRTQLLRLKHWLKQRNAVA